MGTVTIEFVGLFLFNSAMDREKRVAVIDADRDGASHGGKVLPRHEAFFTASVVPELVDWPTDGVHYELAGTIQFEAQGTLRARQDRWTLPRIASGCQSLTIPDSFFAAPSAGQTHAIIVIRAGELCAWRFETKSGPGAINTRLTIEAAESFAITRNDGKSIKLDPATNPRIVFWNTEPVETADDRDWYWYYVATGSECVADPNATGIIPQCDAPPGMNPLSLGCSNSNYP
jgi:hypothetical protein